MTPWAPTRLTSCIFHPGPTEAYEPLRSTLCPARTPFRDLAAPGSTRKPVLHTRGISQARSFDLEVTPWAPTRLTSSISHTGPKESCGASTLTQAAQERPGAISPPRNPTCEPKLRRRAKSRARAAAAEWSWQWRSGEVLDRALREARNHLDLLGATADEPRAQTSWQPDEPFPRLAPSRAN